MINDVVQGGFPHLRATSVCPNVLQYTCAYLNHFTNRRRRFYHLRKRFGHSPQAENFKHLTRRSLILVMSLPEVNCVRKKVKKKGWFFQIFRNRYLRGHLELNNLLGLQDYVLLEISSFPGCFAWYLYFLILYSPVDFVSRQLQNSLQYPVLRKFINDNTLNNILTKSVPVGPLGKIYLW